ncbi:MAG: C4-dicarboxylic acid transporter DauA [Proteobacteria bacterium]|nr:C4-dicarboxylic acid transporter DauA [Pseudomonadota bacterium]MBU1639196.1 C4-dicarboxylic acid transporter DauA [Pseudomonadota bacterium]
MPGQKENRHWKTNWSYSLFQSNVFAGITVGIIALPLSMALAIAAGVAPQYGLYTAIIAGILISVSGSSKVNISGPTAAFVVILLPITQQYGLGGLLLSGVMAGVILLAMGLGRMGSLIEFVPYPVTVGFTAGIGTVIATIQLTDFLGLSLKTTSIHYIEKVILITKSLPTLQWDECFIAISTILALLVWPKLKSRIPAHIIALVVGSILAWLCRHILPDFNVSTIGSRFHYTVGSLSGNGIPPLLPHFALPWQFPDINGKPIGVSFTLLKELIGPAFTIAILGALESLLCAVVADSMIGTKTDPNRELIGQGIGNIIIPFFGGIPATAAIARTVANIRSGGSLPLASIVHSIFIMLSILLLSPLLSYIPMASMAALLIVVAWNMSEVKHFFHILKVAPRHDILTLLTCYTLTVLLDMEIAVAVGMVMASILFIKRTIELTGIEFAMSEGDINKQYPELPKTIVAYKIKGPMFFGVAQKALKILARTQSEIKVVIVDMKEVPIMDMTGLVAMESIAKNFKQNGILLIITNVEPRIKIKLRKIGLRKTKNQIEFCQSLDAGFKKALTSQHL